MSCWPLPGGFDCEMLRLWWSYPLCVLKQHYLRAVPHTKAQAWGSETTGLEHLAQATILSACALGTTHMATHWCHRLGYKLEPCHTELCARGSGFPIPQLDHVVQNQRARLLISSLLMSLMSKVSPLSPQPLELCYNSSEISPLGLQIFNQKLKDFHQMPSCYFLYSFMGLSLLLKFGPTALFPSYDHPVRAVSPLCVLWILSTPSL